MGSFVTATEVKAKATQAILSEMDPDDIEDLYIGPAERKLDELFDLRLDTNAYPWHLSGYFQTGTQQATRRLALFQRDMKRALFILINRMALNPDGLSSQKSGRASIVYGRRIPQEVTTLMARWSGKGTNRIVR